MQDNQTGNASNVVQFEAKVKEPARRKKVAILGFTESWKLAPFTDPDYEIWGLNELYMFIEKFPNGRYDRWFEIHKREVYEADKKRTSEHVQRLMQMTVPIYMHQHWDDIPASVEYPLQAVIDAFGGYLTNSISYMIALAILEGFEEIGIYGVDMAHDCTSPDMRVLTADLRWIPAGELEVGQELLAFDEEPVKARAEGKAEFRKYRRTTVTAKSDLVLPCYRLTMADGKELVCSANHPWLTLGGLANQRRWLKTEKVQDQETYPRHASKIVKLMETWDEDHSWDAGYLAAAFDGEGHVSQGKRGNCSSSYMSVGFSQKLNGMSAEVERALVAVGTDYGHSKLSEDATLKYQIKGGRAAILQFLGSVRPRRLMQKFSPDMVGTLNAIANVPVIKKEFLGLQPVVGLSTDTKTIIVEGYASHNTEYGTQRPSCEYFVGVARGRGIKVTIPAQSDLMKALYRYGYEEEEQQAFYAKMQARKQELVTKLNDLERQIADMTEARAQYRGAIQDCEHIIKIWAPPVRS